MQATIIGNACPPQILSKAIVDCKEKYPDTREADMYKSLVKYNVPATLAGSPHWHKRHLNDLLTMVDKFGMPSFFLTLTADEVSETRWKEITAMETILHVIDGKLTWQVRH